METTGARAEPVCESLAAVQNQVVDFCVSLPANASVVLRGPAAHGDTAMQASIAKERPDIGFEFEVWPKVATRDACRQRQCFPIVHFHLPGGQTITRQFEVLVK